MASALLLLGDPLGLGLPGLWLNTLGVSYPGVADAFVQPGSHGIRSASLARRHGLYQPADFDCILLNGDYCVQSVGPVTTKHCLPFL